MPDLIGQSLGRYHILEQLGEGGMATVYKAYDTRLETNVAVKVIRTENLAPSVLERSLKRFEREAKALAKLTHTNIVNILDYGEYEGKPYLVMPFLPAGTLKQKLQSKPVPYQEAARILIPIANALAYAHQQGMVHRDIKPANILITHSGDPMLADFGIAKILETEETATLTGTGVGVGTPEYMAPEQASSKTVDHRADIYSLGVVFYEMVTGRKPYTADTPMAVIIKQASEPLPRPRQFAPNLPQVLENVLFKALAKDPANRYQTMGEFADALERYGPGKIEKPERKSARKLNLRLVWVGVAVLVIAVSGFMISRNKTAVQPSVETADSTAEATRSLETATAQTSDLTTAEPAKSDEWLLQPCNNDLCVVAKDGSSSRPLNLAADYREFLGYGWSPDGEQIAFSACPLAIKNDQGCNLYLVNSDGSDPHLLADNPGFEDNWPAWSPDGQWIAYGSRGDLTIIQPDGGNRKRFFDHDNSSCVDHIAWSLDSQNLAWIGGNCNTGEWLFNNVWIVNIDGSGKQKVYADEGNLVLLAWGPDGKSLAVEKEFGGVYSIDATCANSSAGCENSTTSLDQFPSEWLNTTYPQWGGAQSAGNETTPIPFTRGDTLFEDNFDDGDSNEWQFYKGEYWTVVKEEDGNVALQATSPQETMPVWAFAGSESWENYSVQMKVKIAMPDVNNSYGLDLNFRILNPAGLPRYNYQVIFDGYEEWGGGNGGISKFSQGKWTVGLAPFSLPLNTGEWHKLEVSLFNDTILVYFDDKQLASYTDPAPLPNGQFVLAPSESHPGQITYFDDIKVVELLP